MTQSEMCLSDSPTSQCFGKVAEPGGTLGATEPSQAAMGTQAAVAILGGLGETSGRGEWGEGVAKETVLSNVGAVYS